MKRKTTSVPYKGYIPVYLNDDQKAVIKTALPTGKDILNKLDKYVEDGYRVTVAWDDFNNCVNCSLFDTDVRRPSAGYILSAKHVELLVCLATLVYLHEVVYADGWDIERVSTNNQVNW